MRGKEKMTYITLNVNICTKMEHIVLWKERDEQSTNDYIRKYEV